MFFSSARPTWFAWTVTRPARATVRHPSTGGVSGVEPMSHAKPRPRTNYPPRWSSMSRWLKGRAGWRCELCGVKNGIGPDVLAVHHLDGNKWNLLPWNLAALCQRCHRRVQWTVDFYQANLTGVYPGWLRAHVEAYNRWAQNKGRPQLALALPH